MTQPTTQARQESETAFARNLRAKFGDRALAVAEGQRDIARGAVRQSWDGIIAALARLD